MSRWVHTGITPGQCTVGNWVVQVALKHEVQEIRRVRGEMESLADTVAAHLARYHLVTRATS